MKNSYLALAAGLAMLAAAPVRASDCDSVLSASLKQTGVPYRTDMIISAPGATQPQKLSAIYMVTKLYTEQSNGQWASSPIDAAEISAQIVGSMKSVTCSRVGADTVGGEATTVYTAHSFQDGNTIDTKTWISNSRNLPLKSHATIISGSDTQTIDMTISYDGIQPPAGAK